MWDTVDGLKSANTLPEIFKQYKGDGVLLRDYFRAKGSDRSLPSQPLNVIEEVAEQRPIILGTATAVSVAGAVFYIDLAASNYEATTKSPVQQFDVIEIPAEYLGGTSYSFEAEVMSVADSTRVGQTLTMRFLSSTVYVKTEIPSGFPLAINGNRRARGTGQPKGANTFPIDYQYYWNVIKASIGLEEDVLAQQNEPTEYKGVRWIQNKLTMELERRLERYVDVALHRGNKNDNQTNLVEASGITGDNGIIQSGDGLVTLMTLYSMCATYDTTFSVSHLADVVDGFISQQMFTTEVAGYCGQGFRNGISDMIRDYGKNFSTTDMYDRVTKVLGITPDGLNYNGVNFIFQVLSTLSNPAAAGLKYLGEDVYEYNNSCIFIPDSTITVSKFGTEVNASIPNVGMGHVNNNGENSGKVFGMLKGMTNMESGNLGMEYAGVRYLWKEEVLLFGGAWNQKQYYTKAA
jgi:hypothetical protein